MENISNYRNFNKDELFTLALQLDIPDLLVFCQTNTQTRKICNSDPLWNYRLAKDFPEDYKDFHLPISKKELYQLLYFLRNIKNKSTLQVKLIGVYEIQDLNLGGNNITIPQLELLPDLSIIRLHNNNIENIDKLCNLRNLIQLFLGNNKITAIPKEIGNLQKLALLDLSYNKISNIPIELCSLLKLQVLKLERNMINNIPKEIENLSSNKISSLPEEMGNMRRLRVLYLTSNKIENIPKSFGQLRNLEVFDLRGNLIENESETYKILKYNPYLSLYVNY